MSHSFWDVAKLVPIGTFRMFILTLGGCGKSRSGQAERSPETRRARKSGLLGWIRTNYVTLRNRPGPAVDWSERPPAAAILACKWRLPPQCERPRIPGPLRSLLAVRGVVTGQCATLWWVFA